MSKPTQNHAFLWFIIVGMAAILPARADELKLAVANSTCSAIKEAGTHFERQSGHTLTYLCKSSGRLAKGLTGEAIHADIYISASKKWMDFMVEAKLARPEQIVSPWGNKLVVAVPRHSDLQISRWTELSSDRIKTVLIGDPGTAPFGRYAKQALQNTRQWDAVKRKIVTKKHITLLADTLAEADANTVGILFVSNLTEKHRELFAVDASSHSPIRYYVSPVNMSSKNPAALEFMQFIQGSEAQKIFSDAGFSIHTN